MFPYTFIVLLFFIVLLPNTHNPNAKELGEISGFSRGVVEAFALQRCYAA